MGRRFFLACCEDWSSVTDAWDNPVRTRRSRRQEGRGVHLVWVAPGALRELFIASAGSRAHAGIVFAGVLVDEALKMRCHTACSSRGRAVVACCCIIGPTHCNLSPYRSTPTMPIHGLSTFQTLAPSLASIPGTSFAVSPSPSMHPPLS